MSQREDRELADGYLQALYGISRFAAYLGGIAALLSFGLLIWYTYQFGGGQAGNEKAAFANIHLANSALGIGLIIFGIGTAYMWWGESTLPIVHLSVAAVVLGAPFYMPLAGGDPGKAVPAACYQVFNSAGAVFMVIAVIVTLIDIIMRVRERAAMGMRADQLKYGKGVKEEQAQSVFMGKCWQLPYCRKFVRERCPIYHSKRSCWKEKVGCMCEEEVIRGAMENKVIPKDAVAAARFIPQNNRLTYAQKVQRCKQCVIYNEHQKHKYRLWLVISNVAAVAAAVALWMPLIGVMTKSSKAIDDIVKGALATNQDIKVTTMFDTNIFIPILLGSFMLMGFAYMMKLLEYLIFKVKI